MTKSLGKIAQKEDRLVKEKFDGFSPTEYQECLAFYEWTQYHPKLQGNVIKIVNEGKRNLISGHMLKKIGLSKGVPDYFIPIPSKKYHGLWLEMKRISASQGAITVSQREWLTKLNASGYLAYLVYGCEEAMEVTLAYLDDKI